MTAQPQSPKELPSGCALLFALPFVLAGSYIMAISLGYLPVDPETFKAPRLVVAAAGGVFVIGGFMVILRASFSPGAQQMPIYQWLEFLLVTALLLTFGAVFLWAGFAPGEVTFQTRVGAGGVSTTSAGDSMTGRFVFGAFGLGTFISGLVYAYKKLMTLPMGDDPGE
jgi:hypothetical protein